MRWGANNFLPPNICEYRVGKKFWMHQKRSRRCLDPYPRELYCNTDPRPSCTVALPYWAWTFTLRLNRRTRLLPYKLNLHLFLDRHPMAVSWFHKRHLPELFESDYTSFFTFCHCCLLPLNFNYDSTAPTCAP